MNIICCSEHVELALDMIVDEFETAPVIHNVINKDHNQPICKFCENSAIYEVSNEACE